MESASFCRFSRPSRARGSCPCPSEAAALQSGCHQLKESSVKISRLCSTIDFSKDYFRQQNQNFRELNSSFFWAHDRPVRAIV